MYAKANRFGIIVLRPWNIKSAMNTTMPFVSVMPAVMVYSMACCIGVVSKDANIYMVSSNMKSDKQKWSGTMADTMI